MYVFNGMFVNKGGKNDKNARSWHVSFCFTADDASCTMYIVV